MLIDILALILIVYGFYKGYSRGLINTVFDTLSIVIAIVASLKLSPLIIDVLDKVFKLNPGISFILGFVITFFIIMIFIRFIGKKLESVLKAVKINFVNQIAGGLVMAMVFAILFSGLLWLSNEVSLLPQKTKDQSITYPVLHTLPDVTIKTLKGLQPFFADFWAKTIETIDAIKDKGNELKKD